MDLGVDQVWALRVCRTGHKHQRKSKQGMSTIRMCTKLIADAAKGKEVARCGHVVGTCVNVGGVSRSNPDSLDRNGVPGHQHPTHQNHRPGNG